MNISQSRLDSDKILNKFESVPIASLSLATRFYCYKLMSSIKKSTWLPSRRSVQLIGAAKYIFTYNEFIYVSYDY